MRIQAFQYTAAASSEVADGANGGRWTENDLWEGLATGSGGCGSPLVTFYSLSQLRNCMANAVVLDSHGHLEASTDDIARAMSADGYTPESIAQITDCIKFPRRSLDSRDSICSIPPPPNYTRNSSASSIYTISSEDSSEDGQSSRTVVFSERDSVVQLDNGLPRPSISSINSEAEILTIPMVSADRPILLVVRLIDPSSPAELQFSLRYQFVLAGGDAADPKGPTKALASLLLQPSFEEAIRGVSTRAALLTAVDDCLKRFLVLSSPAEINRRNGRIRTSFDDLSSHRRRKLYTAPGDRKMSKSPRNSLESDDSSRKASSESGKSTRSISYTELRRTGRFFGGLIDDIRQRLPFYKEDITDAFNVQSLMSVIFIFFVTCASAVAFGELIEEKTDHWIGVSEMLAAHAVCNIVWGLTAGQPLCIQAGVGLLLAFEGSLYKFCDSYEIDFMAMRVWTGLWVVVFVLMITMFDGASLIRFLTRYTEETSVCLIAFFFLYEAAMFFLEEFEANPIKTLYDYCFNFNSSSAKDAFSEAITATTVSPLTAIMRVAGENSGPTRVRINGSDFIVASLRSSAGEAMQSPPDANSPDTALLTLILAVVTFGLVYWLSQLRSSKYFGRTMRKLISDLAVPIALLVVILLDQLAFKDTETKHLDISTSFGFTPTKVRDSWLVSPLGNGSKSMPVWAMMAAIIPAISVCILVFAEVELAEMQLSKPERLLRRPQGFHWDLVLCGLLIFVCSLLGLPWMCTAAVQTSAHVNSLTVMSKSSYDNVKRPSHVIEQRVTCVVIGCLHGIAALSGMALHVVPVAALFGIFIFLGVAGLSELQLTHRIVLLLVPPKHFPRLSYCTKVPFWRLHLFTLIQMVCVCALCILKVMPPASFMFPIALVGCALLRQFILPKLYTSEQLEAIDGEEEEDEDEESDREEQGEQLFEDQIRRLESEGLRF